MDGYMLNISVYFDVFDYLTFFFFEPKNLTSSLIT